MIVQRIWLHQINDIESVKFASSHIRDAEIVPLSVTSCVVIGLQDQVVLILVHLDGSTEIPWFEPRLKLKSGIAVRLLHVVRRLLSFFAHWSLAIRPVSGWIYGIVNNSSQHLLVGCSSLWFSLQSFLQDEFLRWVQRLKLTGFFRVDGWILHQSVHCSSLDRYVMDLHLNLLLQSQAIYVVCRLFANQFAWNWQSWLGNRCGILQACWFRLVVDIRSSQLDCCFFFFFHLMSCVPVNVMSWAYDWVVHFHTFWSLIFLLLNFSLR